MGEWQPEIIFSEFQFTDTQLSLTLNLNEYVLSVQHYDEYNAYISFYVSKQSNGAAVIPSGSYYITGSDSNNAFRTLGTYENDNVPDFLLHLSNWSTWIDGGFYIQISKLDSTTFPNFFV